MEWYVERGFEDNLIKALDTYGSACILGLAGMGKTTTARYIYTKLRREGVKVVYLTSDEVLKTIKFKVAKDEEEEIRCISLKRVWSGRENEAEILAYAIVGAIEGTYLERIRKKACNVINWLSEKLTGKKFEKLEHLENIKSKIESSSNEVKEIADKIYEWVEDVFGKEFVDTLGSVRIKSKIEEFLKNYDDNDLFYLLLELSIDLSTLITVGVAGSSVIKSMSKLLKREPKIEDVVIIVDDLADFGEYEIVNFVKFLRDRGIKILFVKRIDDSSNEGFSRYLEVAEFLGNKCKGLDLNAVLFRGAKSFFDVDLRERIFLIDSAEKEEFIRLLEANNYSSEVIKEKLDMEFNEALDLIYRASAGTICIALYMLEMEFSAEDMKRIAEAERYYSWFEITRCGDEDKKRKMIESNKMLRFGAIFEIYRTLLEYNPCYIALIINDLAEDELKMFCEDERIKKRFGEFRVVSYRDRYYWMLDSYEERWVRDGKNIRRRFYMVKDWWRKLNVFIEALCDFHEYGKEIEEDLKVIREVLLDIFDKELKDTGGFTDRMILVGLGNIKWIANRDKEILKPKWIFIWCGKALRNLPREGLRFLPIVLEIWENKKTCIVKDRDTLLHALSFARNLAEAGRNLFEGKNYVLVFFIVTKFLDVEGDNVILCLKVWIYSSLAYGLMWNGFYKEGISCLKQAEDILKNINGSLKTFAEIEFLMRKAEIENFIGDKNKAIDILRDCLNMLENLSFKDDIGEIFKQLGGNVKEKFEHQVHIWKGAIYYSLGIAYFSINLEKSEEFFKKSFEFSYHIGDRIATISFIGRKNILSNYAFEFIIKEEIWNFEKLWELCEKHEFGIDNETLACRCAEYLIYSILTKNPKSKKEILKYVDLYNMVRTFFYGLCWILGSSPIDLKKTIEILRDYDLSKFSNDIITIENQDLKTI